jgi:hypothetical protein
MPIMSLEFMLALNKTRDITLPTNNAAIREIREGDARERQWERSYLPTDFRKIESADMRKQMRETNKNQKIKK